LTAGFLVSTFLATGLFAISFLRAADFAMGFLTADRLAVLLVGFRRAAVRAERRAGVGRLTERDFPFDVLPVFRFPLRLPAVRLAMMKSFRNLDSFAISVVRSVAYRKSASPCAASMPA
jgi:hypothetical protein